METEIRRRAAQLREEVLFLTDLLVGGRAADRAYHRRYLHHVPREEDARLVAEALAVAHQPELPRL